MIAFVVNRLGELGPEQTTTRLIEACLACGREVAVLDVFGLSVHGPFSGGVWADAAVFDAPLDRPAICQAARTRPRVALDLGLLDLAVIRTSPGRDLEYAWAHRLMLQAMRMVRDDGVSVANDPIGLERASSKLYSACLPGDLTPQTLVTHSAAAARSFIDELGGPVVLKPLLGSGGRDVFYIEGAGAVNLRSLCALLGRTGYFVVQQYVPEADAGDIRVLVLDGDVLAIDGVIAAVRRTPPAGEFRSNISLGSRAEPTELTDRQRQTCRRAAGLLLDDDIRFAGLDLIGDQIVEVNVYSTGGVVDAEAFYDKPYAQAIMDALLGAR